MSIPERGSEESGRKCLATLLEIVWPGTKTVRRTHGTRGGVRPTDSAVNWQGAARLASWSQSSPWLVRLHRRTVRPNPPKTLVPWHIIESATIPTLPTRPPSLSLLSISARSVTSVTGKESQLPRGAKGAKPAKAKVEARLPVARTSPKTEGSRVGNLEKRLAALKQEEATDEMLRVIGSSPTDVRPVFATIVRSAVRLCGGV